ncbi:MAG: sigma-70 family RNA polymerase sigma factor [Hyphomicrobiaceae bacterium]
MAASKDNPDLRTLLNKTAYGNERAFAELYRRTSAKLFGVMLRICGDRELARDALQDCYVRIWNKAQDYDPDIAAPISWMAAIARNRAIDIKRSQAERISSQGIAIDEVTLEATTNPLAEAELSDDLRRLMLCLGELPEERREMVLLAYYAGWSRDELAAKFTRPVATVKTLLRRSLAMLKGCLDG